MTTTAELAWVAGFLEGEGTFAFSRSAQVTAVQVQREPLDRLLQILGGTIQGPYENKKSTRCQPFFRWCLYGAPAAGVMFTMFPWMSLKRRVQIKKAIARWRAMPGRGYRSDLKPLTAW